MSTRLYVGNLPFSSTEQGLEELFGHHGEVKNVKIITERETGRSRGFAFVEMSSGGEKAISALNGSAMDGRSLTVNEAKPRVDR